MSENLTKFERETVINFNEAEPMAQVYTSNTRLKKRLSEIRRKNPSVCEKIREDDYGFEWWNIDKQLVSLRSPWSEEAKEKSRELARVRGFGSKGKE